LRGQAHYAKFEGDIYVNNRAVSSLGEFRSRMSFVPQDDIMNEQLTVEENILYAAVLFNKRGYTRRSECIPFVHFIESLLGIDFIRHSIVGSAEHKG
jgi:ABC-type multidrug transport system ATPase subunit